MRKDVQYRFSGPFALVHVVNIFGKACQIDNPEVRTARGPRIRSWFTKVVPASPDKHSREEVRGLYYLPGLFVCGAPGSTTVVVSRTTEVSVAILQWQIPTWRPATNTIRRKIVTSSRREGRRRFGTNDFLSSEQFRKRRQSLMRIVCTNEIKCARGDNTVLRADVVAGCRNWPGFIQRAHDTG